jgi:integral membrane protein
MTARRNPIPLLRTIGLVEGTSFLVLLLIAMPLKYAAGMPLAVKVVGWAHGVLFAAFVATLVWTMIAARWPLARGALVFVAALLPFGPFVVDRRMKGYSAEFDQRAAVTSS